jgi:molecular chaperone DnaK
LADAKKALEGSDPAAMNSARERLMQASHKLAEEMYKAAQPQTGAPGGGPQTGAPTDGGAQQQKKDEGVIDAEYVDVEDKK